MILATHAGGDAIATKWEGKTYYKDGTFRIRVSSLACLSKRVYIDPVSDVAILEMPADFWSKLDIVPFEVRRRELPLEQSVKVWGFPSTVIPQLQTSL